MIYRHDLRRDLKYDLGILGGGQLGHMLMAAGRDWGMRFKVLDPDPQAPCAGVADTFVVGSLQEEDTVHAFASDCACLTIEIEHVHAAALQGLENEGLCIYPSASIIACLQDKGQQKAFFEKIGVPTAAFVGVKNREDAHRQRILAYPLVQKLCRAGYDGRGVQYLHTQEEATHKAFDQASVLEEKVSIHKELAVMVARTATGDLCVYPPVEMVFHDQAHLLDYLLCPAVLTPAQARDVESIARLLAEDLGLVGILAIELFLTPQGKLLVNEVAPRVHNSGHHGIEAQHTSQYRQLLRILRGWSLGEVAMRSPVAGVVNMLGARDAQGTPHYPHLPTLTALPGVYVHVYGKKIVKPFRKMGHITVLGKDLHELETKIKGMEAQKWVKAAKR